MNPSDNRFTHSIQQQQNPLAMNLKQSALGMGGHHSAKAQKDEWLTPPDLLRALGPFDLDPCSPITRPWPTAARHLTVQDNGLLHEWAGRVWCNPPYGRETGRWLSRCADHGNVTALIFARTETADWVRYVWSRAYAVMFLFGRLHFCHSNGERAVANAGAPSALVAYDHANTLRLSESGLLGKLVILHPHESPRCGSKSPGGA